MGRRFQSSGGCSACGHALEELRLDRRRWTRPKCGARHGRGLNAARNILDEGLTLLAARGAAGEPGAMPRTRVGMGSRGGTAPLAVPVDEARAAQTEPPGRDPGSDS